MPRVSPGDRYRYDGDPVGNDAGRVDTGTVVTVRELVGADTPGAFDDSADAVVVEWDAPSLGTDDDGSPAVVYTPRSWSVAAGDFGEHFSKVKE